MWALGLFALWLFLIPISVRKGLSLGLAILAAGVGLSIGLGRGLGGLAQDAWAVSSDVQLLELMAIITLIYDFSFLLKATRRMEAVAEVLQRKLHDPRWVMFSVPALVGLIPMPAGAMFTAPITDEVGKGINASPEDKVFSNYWFRHCWELGFPLYPGIILCAGLTHSKPGDLTLHLLPLWLTAFGVGMALFWFRTRNPGDRLSGETADKNSHSALAGELPEPTLWALWPIFLVVGIAVARINLVPGMAAVILIYALSERIGIRDFLLYFRRSFNGSILLLIWSVFLFGRVLTTTGLLELLATSLLGFGLPLICLNFFLPFLMGFLTGVTTGFVGTVFPFLIPFWGQDATLWLQFAYASGLAGVDLSPAHLCLSMTQEYFKASLKKILLLILVPVGAVMIVAWIRLIL